MYVWMDIYVPVGLIILFFGHTHIPVCACLIERMNVRG